MIHCAPFSTNLSYNHRPIKARSIAITNPKIASYQQGGWPASSQHIHHTSLPLRFLLKPLRLHKTQPNDAEQNRNNHKHNLSRPGQRKHSHHNHPLVFVFLFFSASITPSCASESL
jgi:hypothetical protein